MLTYLFGLADFCGAPLL